MEKVIANSNELVAHFNKFETNYFMKLHTDVVQMKVQEHVKAGIFRKGK